MEEIKIGDESIFLKKDRFGWRVVYPIKIDGKINWKNLLVGGSYFNLIKVGFIVGLIILVMWSYNHDINAIRNSCQNVFQLVP